MSMSFDPASAAAAMAAARELQALREMAEKDRDDLVIQGEIIMKISDLLIVQQAFAGDSHEEDFLLRFKSISAVTEITPARLQRVVSLQDDMLSLMRSGFSISCKCEKCLPKRTGSKIPKLEKDAKRTEQQLASKISQRAQEAAEAERFQATFASLSKKQQSILLKPSRGNFKWAVAVTLLIASAITILGIITMPSGSNGLSSNDIQMIATFSVILSIPFWIVLAIIRSRRVKRIRKKVDKPHWITLSEVANIQGDSSNNISALGRHRLLEIDNEIAAAEKSAAYARDALAYAINASMKND
jgi:hypothetical protein